MPEELALPAPTGDQQLLMPRRAPTPTLGQSGENNVCREAGNRPKPSFGLLADSVGNESQSCRLSANYAERQLFSLANAYSVPEAVKWSRLPSGSYRLIALIHILALDGQVNEV